MVFFCFLGQISLIFGLIEDTCILSYFCIHFVVLVEIRKENMVSHVYEVEKGRSILYPFQILWIFFFDIHQNWTSGSALNVMWNLKWSVCFPYSKLKFITLKSIGLFGMDPCTHAFASIIHLSYRKYWLTEFCRHFKRWYISLFFNSFY